MLCPFHQFPLKRVSGLLNVQSGPMRAPFERQLDAPGDCFCSKTGRLPALHNGLNDIRRQECQADQATYIANGEPVARSDLSERGRFPGADRIEPAMCPGDGFQQRQIDRRLNDCDPLRLAGTQLSLSPQSVLQFPAVSGE